MLMSDLIKVYEIADELGKEEIVCQLSEECSELIQACLNEIVRNPISFS